VCVCVCVCVCVLTCMCVCVCVYIYIYIICLFIYLFIYLFASHTKPSAFSCISVLCYEISHFSSVAFSLFDRLETKYNAFFVECVLFEKLISHTFNYGL